MAKGSDNPFPSVLFVEGSAPSSPAATNFRLYYDSADHLLKWKNSAGTVKTIATGTGSYSGPTWSTDTSMPGGPATNDRVTRTDLTPQDWVYDGTRWRSVEEYEGNLSDAGASVTGGSTFGVAVSNQFDIWVTRLDFSTFVNGTNNGTNNWTIQASKISTANAATSLGTASTSADAGSAWTQHSITIGAAVVGASFPRLRMDYTKTLTPGALYIDATFRYQLIGV